MISHYALIVFLLVWGISTFVPFKHSAQIAALAAIVAGLGMLLKF